jgi:RND family efflux transporter MFP subunit
VDIGQYVSPPQVLARIYSTEKMEVVSYASPEDLKWIKKGAKVEVISDIKNLKVNGVVKGLGGEVDEKTGLIPIIIEVRPRNKEYLLPEDYVKVFIKGPVIKKAIIIPLNAIHQEKGHEVVWIVDNQQRLRFRKVKIAFVRKDQVIITEGLKEGDKVIISPLSIVSEGMKVRVQK